MEDSGSNLPTYLGLVFGTFFLHAAWFLVGFYMHPVLKSNLSYKFVVKNYQILNFAIELFWILFELLALLFELLAFFKYH